MRMAKLAIIISFALATICAFSQEWGKQWTKETYKPSGTTVYAMPGCTVTQQRSGREVIVAYEKEFTEIVSANSIGEIQVDWYDVQTGPNGNTDLRWIQTGPDLFSKMCKRQLPLRLATILETKPTNTATLGGRVSGR